MSRLFFSKAYVDNIFPNFPGLNYMPSKGHITFMCNSSMLEQASIHLASQEQVVVVGVPIGTNADAEEPVTTLISSVDSGGLSLITLARMPDNYVAKLVAIDALPGKTIFTGRGVKLRL